MTRRSVAVVVSFFVVLGFVTTASSSAAGAKTRAPLVSGPVTGGKGIQAIGISYDFKSVGYVFDEYFYEGDAVGYRPIGRFGRDGKWRVAKTTPAPFKTRMIIVRPEDPAKFNGTVFVEWFNVTGGVDAGPTFLMAHNQMLRSGAAWVGVTAQAVGVTGATETVQSSAVDIPKGGLVHSDPERYGTLRHPGDLYSYDIFSQAGLALRGHGTGVDPFRGYKVKRLIAMGESQSAGRLTTYVNAVHPGARVFDGFLIHSRGTTPAPLGDRQTGVVDPTIPAGTRISADIDVPVLIFETEYDVIGGYADARQPDSRNIRVWEVAGTSHIDSYTGGGYSLSDLGDGAAELAQLDPARASGGLLSCSEPLNAGGQYAVLASALAHLDAWVRKGTPPPKFPRLDTSGHGDSITAARDGLGIARGGIRTPIVDAPLAANTGFGTNMPGFCRVFGQTKPFDAATLAKLYPHGSSDYVKAFDRAVTRALKAGVWLEPEAKNFEAAARKISFG